MRKELRTKHRRFACDPKAWALSACVVLSRAEEEARATWDSIGGGFYRSGGWRRGEEDILRMDLQSGGREQRGKIKQIVPTREKMVVLGGLRARGEWVMSKPLLGRTRETVQYITNERQWGEMGKRIKDTSYLEPTKNKKHLPIRCRCIGNKINK